MLLARVPAVVVVSVNLQPEHKAVLEGDTEIVLTSQDVLAMPVNGLTLNLRPNSFFQTNTAVAAGLYRQAQDWMREVSPDAVLDLYCGVGGFALHAAQAGVGRVLGVEVSPDAVAERRADGRGAPHGGPDAGDVEFRVGDATDVGRARPRPAAVRTCDWSSSTRPAAASGPTWRAGSSSPGPPTSSTRAATSSSLARDLALLPSYVTRRARLFDMFPQTSHHEVIVLLERR